MSHSHSIELPTADQVQAPPVWDRLMWTGVVVGVLALAGSWALRGSDLEQFAFQLDF